MSNRMCVLELSTHRSSIRSIADQVEDDAPATAGFLEGVADDLDKAMEMLENGK